MKRVDTLTSTATAPSYPQGPNPDQYFTDGGAEPGDGTIPSASWFNMTQEELAKSIESYEPLDPEDDEQLKRVTDRAKTLKSHATDTGVDSTDETRALLASTDSQASGDQSAVISSRSSGGSIAVSGNRSAVIASESDGTGTGIAVSGNRSAVIACGEDSVASGNESLVAASNTSQAVVAQAAVIASEDSVASPGAGRAAVIACNGAEASGISNSAIIASDASTVSGNSCAAIAVGAGVEVRGAGQIAAAATSNAAGSAETNIASIASAVIAVTGPVAAGSDAGARNTLAAASTNERGDRVLEAGGDQSVVLASEVPEFGDDIQTTGRNSAVIASESSSGAVTASGAQALVAATNGGTASGNQSAVIAAEFSVASTDQSAVIASSTTSANGTNSLSAASDGGDASGDESAVIASFGGTSSGDRSAVIASYGVEASVGRSAVVASGSSTSTGIDAAGLDSAIVASDGDNITTTGQASAVLACGGDVTAEGAQSAVIASAGGGGNGTRAEATRSAVIASDTDVWCRSANSVLIASSECELNRDYSIGGGPATTGITIDPATPNHQGLTWRISAAAHEGGEGEGHFNDGTTASGADYAEMLPNVGGAPADPGALLALDGAGARPAVAGDPVLGVVSTKSSVLGNEPLGWNGQWLRDEWGRIQRVPRTMVRWPELREPHREQRVRWPARREQRVRWSARPEQRVRWPAIHRDGYDGPMDVAPESPPDAEPYREVVIPSYHGVVQQAPTPWPEHAETFRRPPRGRPAGPPEDCVRWTTVSEDRVRWPAVDRDGYDGPLSDAPRPLPQDAERYTASVGESYDGPLADAPEPPDGAQHYAVTVGEGYDGPLAEAPEPIPEDAEHTTTETEVVVRKAYEGWLNKAPMEPPEDAETWDRQVLAVNPDFDPHGHDRYRSRRARPEEWTCVGLLGQLRVRVDTTVRQGDWVVPSSEPGLGTQGDGPPTDGGRPVRCLELLHTHTKKRGFAIVRCLVG